MHCSTANFDGYEGVECRDGELEWLEAGDLVGKDSEGAVVGAQTDTSRERILVWAKPSIGLGLLEYPVEGSVVSVVVHWATSEDGRGQTSIYACQIGSDRDLRSGQMGKDDIRVRITRGIRDVDSKSGLVVESLLPSATMSRRPSVELAHSSEEDTTASSLSPPRPFFLAGSSDHGHGADQSDSDSSNNAPIVPPRKQRNHHRRRSALGASQFSADSEDGHVSSRPPPSAFAFPFQAYPGNPDPIPGRVSRRSSVDSVCMVSRSAASNTGPRFPRRPQQDTLARPKSPFKDSPYRSSAASVSSSAIYRSSAAAAAAETTGAQIPRTSSATTIFRSPFLSPASRPLSLWSPPNVQVGLPSRTGSASLLPLPPIPVQKKTMPSTRLKEKLTPQDKPWLAQKKSSLERASKWVTFAGILIGLLIAAYIAFRGYTDVRMLTPNQLCVVLDEQFGDGSLDQDTWSIDVELGGYG